MKLSFKKIMSLMLALVLAVTAVQLDKLSVVEAEDTTVETTISAGNTNYVKANAFKNVSETSGLGGAVQGDLRYNHPALYDVPFGIYTPNDDSENLGVEESTYRWPYAAIKVNAPQTGEYDFSLVVNSNTSATYNTFGMIVDGVMHVLSYDKTSSKANAFKTLSLSKGTHIIVFTTCMPTDSATAKSLGTDDSSAYAWFNFQTFTAKDGLEFEPAPTAAEVIASVKNRRIEAEDTEYVTYNGYVSSKTETPTGASNQTVGGVSKGNLKQTSEELTTYLDKKTTAYLEYKVEAPADGKYNIRVAALPGTTGTSTDWKNPYSVVLVNDKAYTAEYDAGWGKLDAVNLAVDMKKGQNIIRVTTITTDQDCFSATSWINQDYLEIDSKLSAIANGTSTTLTGEDEKIMSNNYTDDKTDTNTALGGSSGSGAKTNMTSVETLASDAKYLMDKWSFVAVNVTADKDGYYDIYTDITTKKATTSTQIGMLVDGIAYGQAFRNASDAVISGTSNINAVVDTSVYLTAGTHTIVFTTPIPATRATAVSVASNDWNMYPWMDFNSFTFGSGLTINEAPDKEEFLSGIGTRIEAEDTTKVTYDSVLKSDGNDGGYRGTNVSAFTGSSGTTVGGVSRGCIKQSYDDISVYLDKTSTPYVQYVIEAPQDGEYEVRVGVYAHADGNEESPYITLMVNDEVYREQFTGAWKSCDSVEFTVFLKEGYNVIRSLTLTTDQNCFNTSWMNQDFLDISGGLVPVTVSETDAVVDATESKVISNQYNGDKNVNNGTLEDSSQNLYREDRPSIETLEIDFFKSYEDWPWIAMKVNAVADGYYDITANIGLNPSSVSNNIGMLVDGIAYGKPFRVANPTKIDATVYLTQGEHIIVFTQAMPESEAKADEVNVNTVAANYPWFNFGTVELGTGLTLTEETLTSEQLKTSVRTRIEAEESEFVTYNIYKEEKKESASGGNVTGGVKQSKLTQTYSDLSKYTDKITPYVQYAVSAEEAGEYYIRVVSYVGSDASNKNDYDLPFIPVLVNGKAYKAQFEDGWNTFNSSVIKVTMREGINYIRCAALTTDQDCYAISCYINHDYIEVSNGLTVVPVTELSTTTTTNAGDETKVLFKNLTDNGDSLGKAVTNDMKYDRMSIENVLTSDWSRLTYSAIKIHANQDGYYDIAMEVKMKGTSTSNYVALLVDGENIYPTKVTALADEAKQTIGVSIPLSEGTHTILVTTPMPTTQKDADAIPDGESDSWTGMNNAYPWFDFFSFTMSGGLTVQSVPTEEEVYPDDPALGDVNFDNSINDTDAELLRKYLVSIVVEINLKAANAHADDVVDVKDLVAILKLANSMGVQPTVYLSDFNEEFALQSTNYVTTYSSSELDESSGTVITIDSLNEHRTIHGFGASMTDTSASMLSKMPASELNEAMTNLFDQENGIGLSMLRNTIGTSDFSEEYYTYDDIPNGETDTDLSEFDFSKAETIVTLTKQAQELNPDLKLFLASWTAPLWMKDHYKWASSTKYTYAGTEHTAYTHKLRKQYYDVYANYLVKSVQEYEKAGIPVYSLSAQNEPFTESTWPGMYWDEENLISFTNNNLRPALVEAGLNTKILNLDYNFRNWESGKRIMDNTMNTTDGLAFHWYGGEPEVMETFSGNEKYSDKLIYVTEASSGSTTRDAYNLDDFLNTTEKTVRSLRSGAQGFMTWNIALAPEGGPTYNDVNEHCFGLLTCDTSTGKISYTKEFFALAHFSKFIKTDAVCVDSTDTGANTEYNLVNVVTKNTDGTMTAVLVNSYATDTKVCKLVCGEKVIEITLAPRSAVTLTWHPDFEI